MRARAVLSAGANLGDRLGSLQGCVQAIGQLPDTDVLAISPVYETAPVGGPAQPDYLNAVLLVQTGLPPRDLLDAIHHRQVLCGPGRSGWPLRACVITGLPVGSTAMEMTFFLICTDEM